MNGYFHREVRGVESDPAFKVNLRTRDLAFLIPQRRRVPLHRTHAGGPCFDHGSSRISEDPVYPLPEGRLICKATPSSKYAMRAREKRRDVPGVTC